MGIMDIESSVAHRVPHSMSVVRKIIIPPYGNNGHRVHTKAMICVTTYLIGEAFDLTQPPRT